MRVFFSLNYCFILRAIRVWSPQGIVPTLIIIYTALGRTTELTGRTIVTVTASSAEEPVAERTNSLTPSLQQDRRPWMAEDHCVDLEPCPTDHYNPKSSMDIELSTWQAPRSISLDLGHQRSGGGTFKPS